MGLFFVSCPSNVAWLIPSIVINAIKGLTRQRFSYLGQNLRQKSLKNAPRYARRNASTAVIRKLFVVGVEASVHDRGPASIDRRSSASRRMSVFRVASNQFFSVGAAATGRASAEVLNADDFFGSTVASAKPARAFFHVGKANNGQSTKSLTCSIFESGHRVFSRKRSVKGRPSVSALGRPAYSTTEFNDGGGGLSCRDGAASLGFSVVRGELLPAVWPDGRRRNYFRTIEFRKRGE